MALEGKGGASVQIVLDSASASTLRVEKVSSISHLDSDYLKMFCMPRQKRFAYN